MEMKSPPSCKREKSYAEISLFEEPSGSSEAKEEEGTGEGGGTKAGCPPLTLRPGVASPPREAKPPSEGQSSFIAFLVSFQKVNSTQFPPSPPEVTMHERPMAIS